MHDFLIYILIIYLKILSNFYLLKLLYWSHKWFKITENFVLFKLNGALYIFYKLHFKKIHIRYIYLFSSFNFEI